MSVKSYNMSLQTAIRELTLPELVVMFSKSHPAFLAAIVRERSRYNP